MQPAPGRRRTSRATSRAALRCPALSAGAGGDAIPLFKRPEDGVEPGDDTGLARTGVTHGAGLGDQLVSASQIVHLRIQPLVAFGTVSSELAGLMGAQHRTPLQRLQRVGRRNLDLPIAVLHSLP